MFKNKSAQHTKTLEERIKSLEILQRNTRIAIIILVGYSIYDVISADSGSDIIFAHKVKAREFELIDGQGAIYGSWKVHDQEKRTAGLVMQSAGGHQLHINSRQISLMQGRVNPLPRLVLNERGIELHAKQNRQSN